MKVRLAIALIALAVLTRLGLNFLPNPPHNFSPIAAIGLFGAAVFSRRWLALAVPFAALFLSDLVINNLLYSQFYNGFAWFTSVWIYLAFAGVMAIGRLTLGRHIAVATVVGASVAGSLLFFLLTNFSVWLESGMYPKTGAGLMSCYIAGLPFLQNTLLGDLFFSGVLFGAYAWLGSRRFAAEKA
ncbi:MAG TPA: hypothetical protein PKL15_14990 [Saprospiraceae bacterium]|nr:hypothetical protein [Saprospiraceae bacterium]HNL38450.1 hypothetical protein [Saprospiraceae bacterium]HNM26744.1 hypothetical protein [Saprospiraceae bacterium]